MDPKELEEQLPEIIASLEGLNDGLVTAEQMAQMSAEDQMLRSVISYLYSVDRRGSCRWSKTSFDHTRAGKMNFPCNITRCNGDTGLSFPRRPMELCSSFSTRPTKGLQPLSKLLVQSSDGPL